MALATFLKKKSSARKIYDQGPNGFSKKSFHFCTDSLWEAGTYNMDRVIYFSGGITRVVRGQPNYEIQLTRLLYRSEIK